MATISQVSDIHEEPPAMDYASHVRQFNRFLHLLKWFVVHVALMLPALYFYIIGHQPVTGTIFLALGVAALGYGIISTSAIRHDVQAAIDHQPERS